MSGIDKGRSTEDALPKDISDFYKNLYRDDLQREIIKRQDDINQKSSGFSFFKTIREIFQGKEINLVLDIGGNYGIFLKMLSEEFSVKRKVCLDIVDPPVKIDDVEYLIGYAEEALKNIEDVSVDLVLLQDVIEHIYDPDRLILSIRAKLRDGGIIIVTTPNLSSMVNRISLLFGLEPMDMEVSTKAVFGRPGSGVAGHIRNFTFKALRDFFEYYGFSIIKQFSYVSYASKDSSRLQKLVHMMDRASIIFGRKFRGHIFLVAKK